MLKYIEKHSRDASLLIDVLEQKCVLDSAFQHIEVLKSDEFGLILTLDGLLMLTQKDEFIYHEMISHVPCSLVDKVQNVLIIGGGDGGTAREVLRYSEVENIDVVEIDKKVVDVSKEFLSFTASSFDDSKVNVIIEDGLRFVRSCENKYDIIIVDSTDPFGPGEGLFTREFYSNCNCALKDNGVLVCQMESPFYDKYSAAFMRAYTNIKSSFLSPSVYLASIPSYPSGLWSFCVARKDNKSCVLDEKSAKNWNDRNLETRYYNTDLHNASMVLPNFVKAKLSTE